MPKTSGLPWPGQIFDCGPDKIQDRKEQWNLKYNFFLFIVVDLYFYKKKMLAGTGRENVLTNFTCTSVRSRKWNLSITCLARIEAEVRQSKEFAEVNNICQFTTPRPSWENFENCHLSSSSCEWFTWEVFINFIFITHPMTYRTSAGWSCSLQGHALISRLNTNLR